MSNVDTPENTDSSRAARLEGSHATHVQSHAMICRVTGKTTWDDDGKHVCREHMGTHCLVCSICFMQALNDVDVKPVDNDAVHTYFGLSYAAYLVVPRSLLQSMPDPWQSRFVRLMNELWDVYENDTAYTVQAKDENGKFTSDNLREYDRGRRYVVPGEEQDKFWRSTRTRRFHEKFEEEHGMTWDEHIRQRREQRESSE